MKKALKLAAAAIASLLISLSARAQDQSVQPVEREIETLRNESISLRNARQYDAAIASATKAMQLAEGVDGMPSARVGYLLTSYIGFSYADKGDWANAKAAYLRAYAIFQNIYGQQLKGGPCFLPELIADLSKTQPELDARIAYYETAIACYEAMPKPGNADSVNSVKNLAWWYRDRKERADLMAKAAPLLERWIAIAARDLGPEDYRVATLLRARAQIYEADGDKAKARSLYLRALDIMSAGQGPAKGEKAKLKEEDYLLILLDNLLYRGSNYDQTYVDYQARRLNILEQTEGPTSSLTVSARKHLAHLREQFPDWRPPAERATAAKSSPSPVQQAAAPVKSSPASPQGRRLTPENATLKPPKGYEHIKPAQLYSISIEALGDPRWIVARSKEEALQLSKRLYAFNDRFNGCLFRGGYCGESIVLDFGWIAIIQAFRPARSTYSDSYYRDKQFGVYVAYGAGSRQTAIDGALAEYRTKRGNDGPIAQSMRVGLVSEITDWSHVEAVLEKGWEPEMAELNYKTFCKWDDVPITEGPRQGALGPNMNPEPTTGDLDHDPRCKNLYRPDEKLPPPVLIGKKRGM